MVALDLYPRKSPYHPHERGGDNQAYREAGRGTGHDEALSQNSRTLPRGNQGDAGTMEQTTKEVIPLQDSLVQYEISSACERRDRDQFIAACRDALHSALKEVGPVDPRKIHEVIDALDDFLNRAGGRRK